MTTKDLFLNFAIIYPMFMSVFWSIGAIVHYYINEREYKYTFNERPFISVLVPCYNEEDHVEEIIYRLSNLNYENYEIIAIDDGSKDLTGVKLKYIAETNDKVRVVVSKQNRGKANALHLGLLASKGEYLVCVDDEAYIDPDAINYLIPYFLKENNGERIAAVTGNPQVRNRNALLAKIQIAEFSSIVGTIKRAQRVGGLVMTVSGVVVAFSKKALLDVDLWDRDMITEDIAVTWKFHQKNWEIIYEPRAICWMLVPEKLPSLWNQRVRWSEGGVEVLFRHFKNSVKTMKFSMILLFEQIFGIIWAYLWIFSAFSILFLGQKASNLWFQTYFLEIVCLIQFGVAMVISSHHDKTIRKEFIWIIWYPIVYWYFNALCIAYAFIKTILKPKDEFAKWDSPDRGITNTEKVEINYDIESQIDLDNNITTSYKSKFIYYVELAITAILWSTFIYTTFKVAEYIYLNVKYLDISIIKLIENSGYSIFINAYLISVLLALLLLIYFVVSSRVRKVRNATTFSVDTKTMEYFKVTPKELNAIRSYNTQVIDNKNIERRKKLR